MYENCELKDQRLTKRQMIAKPEIKFTQFQALYSLKPEKQVELISEKKEVSLKQMQSLAEKEKKMSDIRTKFQHLSNSTIWEVALEKFPFHSSDATVEHIIGLDFSKSTPPAFSQFCSETVKQQALPKFSHLRTRNAPATHFRQYLKPLIRQS